VEKKKRQEGTKGGKRRARKGRGAPSLSVHISGYVSCSLQLWVAAVYSSTGGGERLRSYPVSARERLLYARQRASLSTAAAEVDWLLTTHSDHHFDSRLSLASASLSAAAAASAELSLRRG